MVQRLPAISRFSTAVTVRAVAMTGRAIRFEGNGLGWGPFLFFGLIVKASRQPVLHQLLSLHLLSFSPHALFWLHFVAVTFFTAAALTASHSFFAQTPILL
jgi:hypothetical protein